MIKNENSTKIGIWIDHENIGKAWSQIKRTHVEIKDWYMQIIKDFAENQGKIKFIRVFFSVDYIAQIGNELRKKDNRHLVTPIPCEAKTYLNNGNQNRKTLVDARLLEDLISTAYEDQCLETFILVTGDKDYLPAIERLIKLKKQVIVIFDNDPNNNQTAKCIIDILNTENAKKIGCKFISIKNLLNEFNKGTKNL